MNDTEEEILDPFLWEGAEYIHETLLSGESVLVHCFRGVSRSVAIVVGYLMMFHSYSYAHALEAVQAVRKKARPNMGFERQLLEIDSLSCDSDDNAT